MCLWGNCREMHPVEDQLIKVAEHNSQHVNAETEQHPYRCRWIKCGSELPDKFALISHVRESHFMLTSMTLPKIFYCHECSVWKMCKLDWEIHCQWHIKNATSFCGFLWRQGCLIVAALCPFCIGKQNDLPSEQFRQFRHPEKLISHLKTHANLLDSLGPHRCPHPCCDTQLSSSDELIAHLISVHGLPCLKGLKR